MNDCEILVTESISYEHMCKLAHFGNKFSYIANKKHYLQFQTTPNPNYLKSNEFSNNPLNQLLSLDLQPNLVTLRINDRELQLTKDLTKLRHYDYETLLTKYNMTKQYTNSTNEAKEAILNNEFLEHLGTSKQIGLYCYKNSYHKEYEVYLFIFETETEVEEFYKDLTYRLYFDDKALRSYINTYLFETTTRFLYLNQFSLSFLANLAFVSDDLSRIAKLQSSTITKLIDIIEEKRLSNHLFSFSNVIERYSNLKPRNVLNLDINFENSLKTNACLLLEEKHSHLEDLSTDGVLDTSKAFTKILSVYSNKSLFFEEGKSEKDMSESIERYMINSVATHLISEISRKGFFHIDLVINDGAPEDFMSSSNVKRFFSFMNKMLGFNEGILHKHFILMGTGYSYVDNLTVFQFDEREDDAKKNVMRLYDILFEDRWAEQMAKLIVDFFSSNYKFNQSNEKSFDLQVFIDSFMQLSDEIFDTVTTKYLKGLPKFKDFVEFLASPSKDRYSKLDNNCQHFSNQGLAALLKDQAYFFSNLVMDESMKKYTIFEPFFAVVDKRVFSNLNNGNLVGEYQDDQTIMDNFVELLKSYDRNYNNFYPVFVRPHYFENRNDYNDIYPGEPNEEEKFNELDYLINNYTIFEYNTLVQRTNCLKRLFYLRSLRAAVKDDMSKKMSNEEENWLYKKHYDIYEIHKNKSSFEDKAAAYFSLIKDEKKKYCKLYVTTTNFEYLMRGVHFEKRIKALSSLANVFDLAKNNSMLVKTYSYIALVDN